MTSTREPLGTPPRATRPGAGRLKPGWLSRRSSSQGSSSQGSSSQGSSGQGSSGQGTSRGGRFSLPRLRSPSRFQVAALSVWALGGVALFACYLHLSRTAAVDSDGASNVLQAWDMLHGNPLLRGWVLSDVSFYTTELPQYALIELIRGLSPDVVHVGAAITYTLLVLLAARLAKGGATGREAVARAAITIGIMLAPQLGDGVYVLLLGPDHVGTAVPVLLVWLLLDRAPRRWYVPVATGVLLTWATIADSITLIIAVAPLTTVCVIRIYLARVRDGRPLRSCWLEISLGAAALLAAGAARAALALIAARGGFAVQPIGHSFTAYDQMPRHVLVTIQGLLLLFGANFFSHNLGLVSLLAVAHLIGLGLAAAATWLAIRRLFAEAELITQVLAMAIMITLAGYLTGTRVAGPHSAREFTAVLPFSAALAGRLLAGPLARARLLPVLALAGICVALSLGREVVMPPVAAQNQQLAGWLAAHRLDYGLSGYWQSASTTVDSGGRVQVVPIHAKVLGPGDWERNSSWYDPRAHDATFVVLQPPRPGAPYPWDPPIQEAFGQPARTYDVGTDVVLVWNRNLLIGVH
jgi:hypothetical protein